MHVYFFQRYQFVVSSGDPANRLPDQVSAFFCFFEEFHVMEKPNVLIIMCDQLNSHVLSCYGGPVPTPNIDRLAREGIRFINATCPMPVCSPSRASFALGQYPHNHGIIHNVVKAEPPFCENITWPQDERGIDRKSTRLNSSHYS